MTSDQLRAFLLSLPHAKEAQHHGQPDFRVRNKIFANLDDVAGAVTVKLATDAQDALMSRRHEAFSLPGGWAKYGWTTIRLDLVDDDEIIDLVIDAWLEVAPESIHDQLRDPNR
jgi:hypothetical protein